MKYMLVALTDEAHAKFQDSCPAGIDCLKGAVITVYAELPVLIQTGLFWLHMVCPDQAASIIFQAGKLATEPAPAALAPQPTAPPG